MKVKNLDQKEVDIIDVFVEVTRMDDAQKPGYWVTGICKTGFFEKKTILKFTLDVEEALNHMSDLKHQIANEVFRDSSLTCGV